MAKRRMLSIDFCESDKFYSLSPTARMLYVHFILNADDDGFVDKWRTIMRCARIEGRFYKMLKDGDYIIELSDHLIVVTDWHRHNTIRADRHMATAYAKELRGLTLDENKRYIKGKSPLDDNQCVPQTRIDKNRIDKSILDKTRIEEDKNSDFTTNNFSYIHTEPASQDNLQSNEPTKSTLISSALRNMINLYFMKKYQSIDNHGFIEHYEARDWMHESGDPILGNYKQYIDEWMSGKKIKGD